MFVVRLRMANVFTDGKCEIPDTLCVNRWFNAEEEKIACAVVCPSQTARQLASATYIYPGWCSFVYGQELGIQLTTKCKK